MALDDRRAIERPYTNVERAVALMTNRLLLSSFFSHQQDMEKTQFIPGIYPDETNQKHEVEVTEEGCIFCGVVNGLKLLCEYPYIGEYCDGCPLNRR